MVAISSNGTVRVLTATSLCDPGDKARLSNLPTSMSSSIAIHTLTPVCDGPLAYTVYGASFESSFSLSSSVIAVLIVSGVLIGCK
jgi:hypothetical protein